MRGRRQQSDHCHFDARQPSKEVCVIHLPATVAVAAVAILMTGWFSYHVCVSLRT